MSANELHKELQSIDPELAKTTHPKDKRKVIRGLEVFFSNIQLPFTVNIKAWLCGRFIIKLVN